LEDTPFAIKQRKAVPHEFVLDAIAPLSPATHSMFGCLAVYVQDKIVLILRDKRDKTADNGVWLATTEEHHQSLRREFPNMRSIQVFGKKVTGWQLLPADAKDFEEAAGTPMARIDPKRTSSTVTYRASMSLCSNANDPRTPVTPMRDATLSLKTLGTAPVSTRKLRLFSGPIRANWTLHTCL